MQDGGHYIITVPLYESKATGRKSVLEKGYHVKRYENEHITHYKSAEGDDVYRALWQYNLANIYTSIH